MTAKSDLAAALAEQIRAAVTETAPAAAASRSIRRPGPEDAVRSTLARAQSYATPSIPSSAPFSAAKRIALRLLRFVWRDQGAFNALALEALGALAEGVASQRESVDRIEAELARLRPGLERWRTAIDRRVAEWERHLAIGEARLVALESGASPTAAGETPSTGQSVWPIPPGVYSLFEERFRGPATEVEAKQSAYLALLDDVPGPVLDVGCGRGEFLGLLAGKGVEASGVESNPIAVAECRKAGLQVEEGDGIVVLARGAPASLGAVVAFQVVEHWSPERTFQFLRQARRALAPGGLLIAETINVDSLSTWKAFFLDPSHVRPVPSEALRFLAEAAGFADARIEYHAPLPPGQRLTETTDNDAKLNRLLFGPQDYALIARVPTA